MAGCKPEYMPLLIAMTKAMAGPEFRRTLLSTHAWAPYCIINGPMARQLGIDTGQGQINEQANMVLGRFLNLAIMNMMGYYVKANRMQPWSEKVWGKKKAHLRHASGLKITLHKFLLLE